MNGRRRRSPRAGVPALFLTLASVATAAAGPPWISVEYPANGIDETTRGALCLVHTYHHAAQGQFPVEGTAEGIVDGKRMSLPLSLETTSRAGVYAVRGALPVEGTWVLVLTMTDGVSEARASALVAMGPGNDEVSLVKVPRANRGNWPRPATDADVEAMLQTAAAVADAQRSLSRQVRAVRIARGSALGLSALLLPLGVVLRSRRRESV